MRILLVEDNPGDGRLAQIALRDAKGTFDLTWAQTMGEALDLISNDVFEIVLLDLTLPDGRGLGNVARIRSKTDEPAIVILTGQDDEETALRAMQSGAQDYLVKGKLDAALLRRVLRYAHERKRADHEIRALNADLEARVERRTHELALANRELEAIAYTVSHDLRAPLRTIGGFSEILLSEFSKDLDPEALDYVRRMHGAALHMFALLEALLILGRVSRAPLHAKPVDVSRLTQEVLDRLMTTEAKPGLAAPVLVVAPHLHVMGDPSLLEIALRNLLANALKFSRNDAAPRIEFGLLNLDGEEVFFVMDNGVGFDLEFSSRLFEPFLRLHQNTEYEGTGIGLATVRRIVQRHGGRIWADSKAGEGACFYFTLPSNHGTPMPTGLLDPIS